jgi:aminopeptidase N
VAKEENKLKNLNLNLMMNTWMKQMGHPLITVENIDNKTISLTQKQFLIDPNSKPSVSSVYE